MDVIFILLIWYAFGLFGSFITAYFAYIKEGLDVEVGDLLTFGLFALAGPLNFIVGILFMFGYIIARLIEKTGKSRNVIWKADE